jgi:hypothetical protein
MARDHSIAYYTERRVRKQGFHDGRGWRWRFWPPEWPFREPKEPQPDPGRTTHADFELALKEGAENDMQILAERWKELDQELKPEFCAALAVWQRARDRTRKEGKEVGPAERRLQGAEQRLLDLEIPALEPRWMHFWLIVIGVAEFPLNALVFELLQQGMIETYIIAAGLGVVIPLLAHTFGARLRQDEKEFIDQCMIATAPMIAFGLLFLVAIIRERFIQTAGGLAHFGVPIRPLEGTILFLAINVALFFVAVFISYEGTHPKRTLYRTRCRDMKHAQRSLEKESGEAAEAAAQETSAAIKLNRLRQTRHKTFERTVQRAELINEALGFLVGVYRTANLESRKSANRPPAFKLDPPKAELPKSLRQALDWDCKGAPQDKHK